MFRKILSSGDLVQLEPTWFGFGPWRIHRNLDEEVRRLETMKDEAKAKYLDLEHKLVIASANVAEERETLQILLLENSEAYFEVDVDNSLLEKREGIRYQFNKGNSNNKKGQSSSNNGGNGGQSNSNGNASGNKPSQNQSGKGAKGIPLSKLLSGSITFH